MIPDLLSTLIGLCLVCFAVLDPELLNRHGPILGATALVLIALGAWKAQADYLKWPGAAVIAAGLALAVAVISGLALQSPESTFWVAFWSGTVAGVVSLWSVLYRGPKESALEPG